MAEQPMVTRTYRAAIKIGDDYVTIEETISLAPTATNDEIAAAVETGLRIYHMQQHAIQEQMQLVREHHQTGPVRILDPESPASDKQRSYLEYLMNTLNISEEAMDGMLRERQAHYGTLTKGVASEIIDQLKSQLDARPAVETNSNGNGGAEAVAEQPTLQEAVVSATTTPASTRQIAALQRVASVQGIDIESEARNRFGAESLSDLSSSEAGALLQDLQRH